MFYVPDDTKVCGFYQCKDCGEKFLDVKIVPFMVCPYCGEEGDMELGPDEEIPEIKESAQLIEVIEGEEEVEVIEDNPDDN